jgi:MFS family permease
MATTRSQARLIFIGAALLLALGMGIRQSFGLFPGAGHAGSRRDRCDFTLALAVQNIVWGLSQALVAAAADRFGLRITMMAGAAIYVIGLGIMAAAQGAPALIVSGALIGSGAFMHRDVIGIDCMCPSGFGEAAPARCLALSSAAGSFGTLVVPLATQVMLAREPWQMGALLFVLLGLAMLPAAFLAGDADRIPGHNTTTIPMRQVLGEAMRNRRFLVMSCAYFVCGLNLVFLSTHLPAYLAFLRARPDAGSRKRWP